jgi:hypothetical protein
MVRGGIGVAILGVIGAIVVVSVGASAGLSADEARLQRLLAERGVSDISELPESQRGRLR